MGSNISMIQKEEKVAARITMSEGRPKKKIRERMNKTTPVPLQNCPNSKTIFHKISPIVVNQEDDEVFEDDECGATNMSISLNLQEYITMEEEIEGEEIKVRWNQFIKTKNRNYLEDYQIIREIGRGSFGKVNKVKSKYTGRFRAAKKIKKSTLGKIEHQKLFTQMSILQSLDHCNIAKLFQVYNYKNHYVLILELCQGGELFTKILVSNGLSQQYIASIVTQILKALLHLKHKGIVHRDLKPQNMLFQKNNKVLKIIDFGIATHKAEKQILRERVGTPYYVAPQVLLKQYDEKCDIWSMGVIMYTMMERKPPFRGDDQREVMEHILKSSVNLSAEIKKKYSSQCIDFLHSLLTKNPDSRLDVIEAFNHPWIQRYNLSSPSIEQQKDVINRMGAFKFKNKLQAVVYTFMVSQLMTTQEKDNFIQIFQDLDVNHDGVISKVQFKEALESKSNISASKMNLMMRLIDTNNSGFIDLTQFIVASLKTKDFFTKDHFQQAFSYFDIDHSGQISYDQIAFFLEDQTSSQQSIRKIFKEIDENNDGVISREQFVQLLMKSSQLKLIQKNKAKK